MSDRPVVPEIVDESAQYFDNVKTYDDVGRALEMADKSRWRETYLDHERLGSPSGMGLRDMLEAMLKDETGDLDGAIHVAVTMYEKYRQDEFLKSYGVTAALEYVLWSAHGLLPPERLKYELSRAAMLEKMPRANERFDEMTDRRKRLDALEATVKRRAGRVIRLGIEPIDHLLNMGDGIYPGEVLHIVGGEGGGKTTLLLDALTDYASQGGRSLFLSLDMSPDAVEMRLLQRELNFSRAKVENHIRGESPWYKEARRKVEERYNAFLHVMGGPLNLEQIKTVVLASEADVIALDYVTLVDVPNCEGNALKTANAVSRAVRYMAHEWGRTFILLSQMSRESKRDAAKGGIGGHGMGGASLEQTVDYEVELFRDAPQGNGEEAPIICTINKNRNGAGKGKSFRLSLMTPSMTFSSQAEEVERPNGRKPLFTGISARDILGA